MKIRPILLAAGLLAGTTLRAQDLANRIPQNALAVASVKGDRLLDLISVQEFNQSFPGKRLLQKASESAQGKDYHSLEDFGIRVSGTAWYYYVTTDSISYNCLLLPLSDAAQFEAFINNDHKDTVERKGNIRKLSLKDDGSVLLWDEQSALLTFGSLKSRYFEDSLAAQRYGIKEVNYSDYYYKQDETTDTAEAPYAVEAAMPAPPVAYDDAVVDTAAATTDVVEEAPPPSVAVEAPVPEPAISDEPAAIDPGVEIAAPPPDYSGNNDAYSKAYDEQWKIKKALEQQWAADYAEERFATKEPVSILDNPAYQRSLDPEAVATFYLSNLSGLYSGILPYYTRRYGGMLNGFRGLNARLYMDDKQARIASELEVDEQHAASYKRIYAKKVNKKFLKYINSDKMIGFMSYAINTEAYLEEVPDILEKTYGQYLDKYEEEVGLGAELFSLLLDEKAVARVIKGDALLLFTDISPKQYTYKTYEYDDNYERKEIERTKTETLPDFLFMMSSDDTHLLERALRYGIHKQYISEQNGIYSLSRKHSKSPFDLHLLIKDGIIFCGTSYRDIQQISTDHFEGKLTAEQKNLILKNNFSVYVNPRNVVGKISEKEFGSSHKLKDFNTFMGNMGILYARSTGIRNNRISGEMVATVPEGKGNALKYFFSLIELMNKRD